MQALKLLSVGIPIRCSRNFSAFLWRKRCKFDMSFIWKYNVYPVVFAPNFQPFTSSKVVPVPDKISAKVVPKIKSSLSFDDSVKSVKYITELRALREYMLSNEDLESLPHYYSRSPYTNENETLVFLKSDVEDLAFAKHGGKEAFFLRRKIIKDMERRNTTDIFYLKRYVKYLRNAFLDHLFSEPSSDHTTNLFKHGPGRVVLFAIFVNLSNVFAKAIVWWYTGSKSIFSEMMHSIADTMNQVLVAFGLYTSLQRPDESHPYGYVPMRNVSSLISGVAVFFLGAGLTCYHGILGIIEPHEVEPLNWAFLVMFASLLSEGSTLAVAYREARVGAKLHKCGSVREWLFAGVDPSTSVILLEDMAAVLGVLVASTAMGITYLTGSTLPDAIGALAISGILASVAGLIIYTNTETLIGRAMPSEQQDAIMRIMDNTKIVRGTYDIKATMVGGEELRFKAEVDIDGRQLTKRYLETLALGELLEEVKNIKCETQLVNFMLRHGDNLVNTLGAEINQIEERIKKECPRVKHIDIEIN